MTSYNEKLAAVLAQKRGLAGPPTKPQSTPAPPYTIRWAPGACPAVIGGHWHREPSGAILASYATDYELALALVFAPEDQLSTERAAAFLQAACATE